MIDEVLDTIINTADNTLECFHKVDEFDVSSKNSCNHKINLFVLNSKKFQFDYDGLKRLIRNNLAEYVFTRKKVTEHKTKGTPAIVALEAQKKLIKISDDALDLKNFGAGGELGEILLFIFLEGYLKARKMLSKIEIKTNDNDFAKGFDGVHFYKKKYDNYVAYQTIFGEAKIEKNLQDALRNAFSSISSAYKNKTTDLNLLEDKLLNEIIVDNAMAETFKTIFIPKYSKAGSSIENEEAFAIFIGYTFEPPTSNGNPPKQLIHEKIKNDITSIKSNIINAIAKEKYTADSDFYIYFLPLNDAIIDKKEIMQEIARVQVEVKQERKKVKK
jgi:hypothetical protein